MTSRVQSVMIPINWGMNRAVEWMIGHDYRVRKIHLTERFFRFRQFEPDASKRYRSFTLPNGIILVLELK